MKKTRLTELLLFGLSNIAAGMLFGTGYLMIEHADNSLWPADDTATEKTATEKSTHIASH